MHWNRGLVTFLSSAVSHLSKLSLSFSSHRFSNLFVFETSFEVVCRTMAIFGQINFIFDADRIFSRLYLWEQVVLFPVRNLQKEESHVKYKINL